MTNYIPLIAVLLFIGIILAVNFSPKARKARAQRKAEREAAELALRTQAQSLFELFTSGNGTVPNVTNDVQGVILRGAAPCLARLNTSFLEQKRATWAEAKAFPFALRRAFVTMWEPIEAIQ